MLAVLLAGCGVSGGQVVDECTVVVTPGGLAAATADLSPGDVLCLDGTFGERLLLHDVHGTAEAPITVRPAPGRTATLDLRNLPVPEGDQGAIEVTDSSHVTIQGLTVTRWRTDQPGHTPAGVLVTANGTAEVSGITLTDLHVHHLGHAFDSPTCAAADEDDAGEVQAFGIVVKGRAATPITDLRIEGNELDHLTLGGSEALSVNGNVDGFAVAGNLVHDTDNIAIDVIGYEDLDAYPPGTPADRTRARNGTLADNRVWAVSPCTNPAYCDFEQPGAGVHDRSADGLYVDGGRDILIERNVVVRADIGIEVAAEYDDGVAEGIVLRSNAVVDPSFAGIALGGYAAEGTSDADGPYNGEGQVTDVAVLHTTVLARDPDAVGLVVQHQVSDTVLGGNLLVATTPVEHVTSTAQGITSIDDLTVEEHHAAGLFDSTEVPDDALLAATGGDLGPTLRLAPGSPALDATPGTADLPIGVVDLTGRSRTVGPATDAGALEHRPSGGDGTATPSPPLHRGEGIYRHRAGTG